MANPATTHVIEIETGIGEPAFIPLSMGHELQPISVGKKGMWRIESPRVLDVHAFVYFDGTSLFLQSADESQAASVDGYRVGKAWTELHAPCKIDIGTARLRFRSLLAEADKATVGMAQPPVQPPAPTAPPPPRSHPATSQPPMATGSRPMMQQQPPPAQPSSPMSFPKPDRPFKPGEFAAPPDDESTRVAPLEATGASRSLSGASGAHPRPAAGAPAGQDGPTTRPDERRLPTGAFPAQQGSGPYGAVGSAPGQQPNLGMPPNSMMQGSMPPGGGMQPMGYPPQGPGGYPPQGYPPGPMMQGPPPQGSMGPSMPPGGFGSMTPQGGMQQPEGNDLLSQLKKNSIPKLIALGLFVVAGILFLVSDDEDEQPVKKKKPVAALDGGTLADGGKIAVAAGGSSVPPANVPPVVPPVVPVGPTAPVWPAGVPCPPPNWPPNTPLPCVPNNVGNPPPVTPSSNTPASPPSSAEKPEKPVAVGTKTLERQAVDYVAAGDTARAAAAYDELTRRDPKNAVYAEAARILRAKLDAGAP